MSYIPEKTALFIIDMQNDVIHDLFPHGKDVVEPIQRVLTACRQKRVTIFYHRRVHRSDGLDVERFRLHRFQAHPFCLQRSKGAEVIEALQPLPTDILLDKHRFSGFFQTDLQMLLTRLGIRSLIVVGVQTPNCIRCTVQDALAYDYEVTLVEDATAAATAEVHQANLFDMRNWGATTCTVAELLEAL